MIARNFPRGKCRKTRYNGSEPLRLTLMKRHADVRKTVSRGIKRVLETVEQSPLTLSTFVLAFLGLILVRLFIESGTNAYPTEGLHFMFFEFSHTFLFFLFAFLIFMPIARIAGAASWTRAANLLLFGFLIIWTPPVIDKIIFQGQQFWSFYELDSLRGLLTQFFTFFDDTPNIGITYGVRAEVALMTAALGGYAWFRSRNILKALGVALLTYAAFFILGTFPSYVAIIMLVMEKGFLSVTQFDIVGTMLSPVRMFGQDIVDPRMSLGSKLSIVYAILSAVGIGLLLYRMSKKTFLALLQNSRFPQVIWHAGLVLLGGSLAMIFADARPNFHFFEVLAIVLLIIAVESAWLASVTANDLADRAIDKVTNPRRPLPTGAIPPRMYAEIGWIFFAVSLFFSAVVSFKAMLLILAYHGLAWVYSMPPLRLKQVPLLATVLAALAGMAMLIAGYSLIAPGADIRAIPMPILAFLFVAYAVTLPLKDFKDIEGDRADGVYTIPVLLGAERARLVVGAALFLCYAASPIIFRDADLIVPAVLFGSLSFWNINRAERPRRSWGTFRTLAGWNMVFATLYGLLLAAILFR